MAGLILAMCDCSELTVHCFESQHCGVKAADVSPASAIGPGRHYQPHQPGGAAGIEENRVTPGSLAPLLVKCYI